MNKKLINLTLASLLLCTVHQSSNGETSPYDPDNPKNGKVVPVNNYYVQMPNFSTSPKNTKRYCNTASTVAFSLLYEISKDDDRNIIKAIAKNAPRVIFQDTERPVLANTVVDVTGRIVASFIINSTLLTVFGNGNKVEGFDTIKKLKTGISELASGFWLEQFIPSGSAQEFTLNASSEFLGDKSWGWLSKHLVKRGWLAEVTDDNDNDHS